MKRNNRRLLLALLSIILLLCMIPVSALAADDDCVHSPLFGVPGTDATCTTPGKPGEVTCKKCGINLQPVTVIPALGHDFVNGSCTRCGEKGTAPAPTPTPAPPTTVVVSDFTDVPKNSYAYDAVMWAAQEGITRGTGESVFSPYQSCTRAQAITFLWRAYGCPVVSDTENPFHDVKEGTYYHDAVLWAVEKGIVTGYSHDTFTPDAPCTRAQVIAFLWRSMGRPEAAAADLQFSDMKDSDYFTPAIQWAVEKDITNGLGNGTFGQDSPCTRAQIITFLYRTLVQ